MPVQGCRPPEFPRREHPGSLALLDGRTQAGHRRVASEPVLPSSNAVTMIISTLYLPATTANVQHQPAPTRSVCASQTDCPAMTSTVRWWLLGIARPQASTPRRAHLIVSKLSELGLCVIIVSKRRRERCGWLVHKSPLGHQSWWNLTSRVTTHRGVRRRSPWHP
jgi:hypothetical protein